MSDEITYKNAGVDTQKGQHFIDRIKSAVHSTHNPRVLNGLGGFSAAYDISFLKNYRHPVLLSGTDGVGTKLELARLLDIHDTIGIDLVAMCVNDLLVNGARPLFFWIILHVENSIYPKWNQSFPELLKDAINVVHLL